MTKVIKITKSFITVDGMRSGINIDCGPWAPHAPQDMIKVRCKKGIFPAAMRDALTITNNSDIREDYFEADCLRLLPSDELYALAKKAAA